MSESQIFLNAADRNRGLVVDPALARRDRWWVATPWRARNFRCASSSRAAAPSSSEDVSKMASYSAALSAPHNQPLPDHTPARRAVDEAPPLGMRDAAPDAGDAGAIGLHRASSAEIQDRPSTEVPTAAPAAEPPLPPATLPLALAGVIPQANAADGEHSSAIASKLGPSRRPAAACLSIRFADASLRGCKCA